jgi:pSer/pThr/pTyr-binding forkhead associated (FHA) protein
MLQITLKVVGGELESDEIQLGLPAVIGRAQDVAITLAHPLVSRHHCELRAENGQLWVRDLGSLNGTFVGSQRIMEAELKPGGLLTVGTVTFRALYDTIANPSAETEAIGAKLRDTVPVATETVREAPPRSAASLHAIRRPR